MISSASFLNRRFAALLVVLCILTGCVGGKEAIRPAPASASEGLIAVLPIDNLTGSGLAPVRQMRLVLLERLKEAGYTLLDDDTLQRFMNQHRIRYIGGIDSATGRALLEEIGVKAVLITNLTQFSAGYPPKIALFCRLVSTGENPEIRWMDGVGMAGDDSPGILDLGLIANPDVLQDNALRFLVNSLSRRISGETGRGKVDTAFRPKVEFNPMLLAKGTRYSIAVVPFPNASDRPHAGEIMGLHFVRELSAMDDFSVTEPGVTREKLLELRILMEQGISLQDLYLIHKKLGKDLLLSGRVIRYEDLNIPNGVPSVQYSTLLMQGEKKRVIWASTSYDRGDKKVYFFGLGRISTAYELATRMVRVLLAEANRRSTAPPKEVPAQTDIFRWILGSPP